MKQGVVKQKTILFPIPFLFHFWFKFQWNKNHRVSIQ